VINQATLCFTLFEEVSDLVVPAGLCDEVIPDQNVIVIEGAPLCDAPLKDLLWAAAIKRALGNVSIRNAQIVGATFVETAA